jgi:Flp pilus assembly secretin CpaC
MNAKLQHHLIALSMAVRFTLAAANAASQPYLESAPSISSPPQSPASSAPRARSTSATADGGMWSGQVVKGPPLTLHHHEIQVLDLPNVTRIAVGSENVLRAQMVGSSQVVLIGEAAGTTSLRVWTRNGTQFSYEVTVRSLDRELPHDDRQYLDPPPPRFYRES